MTGVTERRNVFVDLTPGKFPATLELWGPGVDRDGPPTFTGQLPEPGALQVPSLGWPTWARMTFGDGTQIWGPPPDTDPNTAT